MNTSSVLMLYENYYKLIVEIKSNLKNLENRLNILVLFVTKANMGEVI